MSNSYFRFKQFVVNHDRCAMKVGTDGVLLGAWTHVPQAGRVLDIGTGTGLIALMLAQRSVEARIEAVDVDADAVCQAVENVRESLWADRINVRLADVRQMEEEKAYDVIVSNPPFFVEEVFCPDGRRNAARHSDGLGFDELLDAVARMLTADGSFSVILPSKACDDFVSLAAMRHLYVHRLTWVQTKASTLPKRVLLEMGRDVRAWQAERLPIMDGSSYAAEYKRLTRDFYLAF